MTITPYVFLAAFYVIGLAAATFIARAGWLLTRAETRLRSGLELSDVETDPRTPVDDVYLSDAGRADRRRGWRSFGLGIAIALLLLPAYWLAVLLHVPGVR